MPPERHALRRFRTGPLRPTGGSSEIPHLCEMTVSHRLPRVRTILRGSRVAARLTQTTVTSERNARMQKTRLLAAMIAVVLAPALLLAQKVSYDFDKSA